MLQNSNDKFYSIVFKSLRNVVSNQIDQNKELSFYSKKFLPVLFNIYTNEIQTDVSNENILPLYLMDSTLLETIRLLLQSTNSDVY